MQLTTTARSSGKPGAMAVAATTMPTIGFHWRMNGGELVQPANMQSTHLFYVVRMVWNNCCPPDKRVGKVKLYEFGPTYTTAYMRLAVRAMLEELAKRRDLPQWCRGELALMAGHLQRNVYLLEASA
jgi:hypothetical protein